MQASLLIVEDEVLVRKSIRSIVQSIGCIPVEAGSLSQARESLENDHFEIILLDLRLPDGEGLSLLKDIIGEDDPPSVIILTGTGDPEGAELALKNGAWDYLLKPLTPDDIRLTLKRALAYREQSKGKERPSVERGGIIGSDRKTMQSLQFVGRAAMSDASVLITGETGTGKELFARAIHTNSVRREKPFVTVDCAALSETLVESILFGSRKGAYTGADRDRAGLIVEADGGTLFLDEVGEMPLGVQKTFLRVLQEKSFRPIGSAFEVRANFRLVSATNRNLKEMVMGGRFREDLLFRLQSLHLEIPSLREHKEVLRELIVHYMERLSLKYRCGAKAFTPDFLETLLLYDWPGNVRELIGALEHAFSSGPGEETLYPIHLPISIRVAVARNAYGRKPGTRTPELSENHEPQMIPPWKSYRATAVHLLEKQYFRDLLNYCGWDIDLAAQIARLKRARLYEILKSHHLTR